jgi:2-dehydro-3-deoxygalactonokinase
MTARPCLIGVDWGTTACRAYLIADGGRIVEERTGAGILGIENKSFRVALLALVTQWPDVPILLSGMIGSRQGWVEAPYLACPAGASELANALMCVEDRVSLVPGLTASHGDMPDVMRGEETQVIGALAEGSRLFVLPGTHSKWVEIADGRITSFRTFMTGEVYGALKGHTILGRLMQEQSARDADAFARGVAEGAAQESGGALLHRLFATRTYGLFDRVPATGLADYLSGLLIGAEIAEATRAIAGAPVTILGSAALAERYVAAFARLGRAAAFGPADCAATGQYRLAQAAGLIGRA